MYTDGAPIFNAHLWGEKGPGMVQDERASQDDLRPEIEALKADISALRDDLSVLVQDLIAAGKVQAGEAGAALSSAARSRLEEYGVDLDRLSAHGQEVMESLQEQVERRPLLSLGVALGIGMMLGSIFRRR
jgi:ElaB/YqjD/DUF883 family membrane-anchored ribosome-binding protein